MRQDLVRDLEAVENLDFYPRCFKDQVTGRVMEDPVFVPSSGLVMDYATHIYRVVLSNPDPVTGLPLPLTIGCMEMPRLRERINMWRASIKGEKNIVKEGYEADDEADDADGDAAEVRLPWETKPRLCMTKRTRTKRWMRRKRRTAGTEDREENKENGVTKKKGNTQGEDIKEKNSEGDILEGKKLQRNLSRKGKRVKRVNEGGQEIRTKL